MNITKINTIKASVEILDPNMDPTAKVAKMARICYRSEQQSGPEADKRLISNCIRRGHTSVMEHSLMSVAFPLELMDSNTVIPDWAPKGDANRKISTRGIWNSVSSLDVRRYLFNLRDDGQIVDKSDPEFRKNNPNAFATVDCVCGNLRAWLNIQSDAFDAAIISGEPILVGMMTALIRASLDAYPGVFCELVDAINKRLPALIDGNNPIAIKLGDKKESVTIDDLYELCNGPKFEIVAAPATARASLSVIFTTDRAVTHELVRHRADTAFSQESQRWVNYNNKGFTFIIPSLDPVKFEKAEFPDDQAELLPGAGAVRHGIDAEGYIPESSVLFKTWKTNMENDVFNYEMFAEFDINPADEKIFKGLPPEFNRCVLPNSAATQIGVTFTSANFANFLFWRLGPDAYWPFRRLVGQMIIAALKMDHPFFSNFHPTVIKNWLVKCEEQKICVDKELLNKLNAAQDERLAAIKRISAARKAAAEKAKQEFDAATGRVEQKAAEAAKAMSAK